jgi:hypothetical protein
VNSVFSVVNTYLGLTLTRYKIAATKNYHHVAAGLPRVFVFNDLGLTRYKTADTKGVYCYKNFAPQRFSRRFALQRDGAVFFKHFSVNSVFSVVNTYLGLTLTRYKSAATP